MEIFTSYLETPIGILKIAGTDHSVKSIVFTDDSVTASNTNRVTQTVEQQLREYFAGTRKMFDFPFNQQGSLFQAKVWELLNNIPYGKTLSYKDLSKQYGDVKAIRAVASANGKNNLAIVIPCHRVIGSNATLTGYAGGLWRKRWLLDHEARFGTGVQQLFY
jgi:methylated-DNA-[protein]-cysteine S-methyltransferase